MARRRIPVLIAPLSALVLLLGCTEGTETDDGSREQDGGAEQPEDNEDTEETEGSQETPEDGSAEDGSAEESVTAPNVPDAETARAELAELTVAEEGSMTDYERDLFPHWTEDGECSTRETVLERDGTDVTVGSDCYPESGEWHSPYDDMVVTDPSEVDIDHMVPLAEAWRSGASEWTTDEREAFANDLEYPELLAASADSNSSKGDQDPADWQPIESFHCVYSRMWIRAKHHWELTLDEDEKAALEEMLGTC
ncbi:HNH endonuclease family protein [Streptomyces sp. B6B3]|uniref:HNH endonuclease family protein n=1 Tax=Streptomyces sp. B6B3 TaxID=3153570 RepID=UPI00325E7B6E